LSDSLLGDEEGAAVDELSKLRSRGELFERKLADVGTRWAEAESDLAQQLSMSFQRLGALYRSFTSGVSSDRNQ
jgi:hypothetical protein